MKVLVVIFVVVSMVVGILGVLLVLWGGRDYGE